MCVQLGQNFILVWDFSKPKDLLTTLDQSQPGKLLAEIKKWWQGLKELEQDIEEIHEKD